MDITFHYPPELFNLLVDTIPRLCRSKLDVILFFKGAGVPQSLTASIETQLKQDKDSINKFQIVRSVLTALNEQGEKTLRERREVLKRVVEFENFSSCWPNDQLIAKGLVSEIQQVINVKDSFTRMNLEREKERKSHLVKAEEERQAIAEHNARLEGIKENFAKLFTLQNAFQRGKKLEEVLNDLFDAHGILIREAFCLTGDAKEGIVEQIDGVIELDGHVYLVEMKWWKDPIGVAEVSQHLVRVYHRGHSRGIFISASGYADTVIPLCKESLQKTVICLALLDELYFVVEKKADLKQILREKIRAAIADKNPFCKQLC
ncbi:restriction endonuclease [Salidesulfovibrio brasiliensis]|uniref:restriction endonuclease n=1 Tax=Salidesulfovibrio brasiliensis TaxID=221711 RepID=UPI0012ED20B7|nr:restriction endonuclease [Salidesulfovibrio brasiliensis]